MTDSVAHYVHDLGELLWELADDARQAAAEDPYDRGRAFGLYEAVSLMQQQAVAFGLPPEAVGLMGRDADRDLLR